MQSTLTESPELDEQAFEAQDSSEPPPPFDNEEGGDDGDSEPIRWATVATYWQPTEAHIARLKLEAEEIDCIIVDENVIAVQWLWANALGGIKLQVPEEDLSQAAELLKLNVTRRVISADGQPLFDGQVRCPRCGSEEIDLHRFSRFWSLVSVFLLGIPLLWPNHCKRCTECGFEWPADHA